MYKNHAQQHKPICFIKKYIIASCTKINLTLTYIKQKQRQNNFLQNTHLGEISNAMGYGFIKLAMNAPTMTLPIVPNMNFIFSISSSPIAIAEDV